MLASAQRLPRLFRSGRVTRIPTFSSVRWYSLFEVVSKTFKLKALITEFIAVEDLARVQSDVWATLEELQEFVRVVKSTTKALEGEEVSTICYVIMGFQGLREYFEQLAKSNKDYEDIHLTWLRYFDDVFRSTKENWGGLMELGCFLHPGLDHGTLMNHEDMRSIRSHGDESSEM